MRKNANQENGTKRVTTLLTIIATSLSVLFLQLVIHESQKPDTLYGYLRASTITGEPKPSVKPVVQPPPPPVTTTTTAPATVKTTTTQTSGTTKPTTTRTTRTTTTRTTKPPVVIVQPKETIVETASFLLDSDNDGFTDRTEIRLSTDPYKADSKPIDANVNGISDTWEQKYGIIPKNGEQDTDSDGLSDKLEYFYGTSPVLADTDADSFSDSREVLEMGTNPNDAKDPGTMEKLGIRITGMEENQAFADPKPFIRGIAPANSIVEVVANDSKKTQIILGRTNVQENNVFFLIPANPLEDGVYDLISRELELNPVSKPTSSITPIARAQDSSETKDASDQPEKIVSESAPVRIKIDKGLNVVPPTPQKLSESLVTEENFINDLRVEIIDDKPVLYGKTAPNSEVKATWNSIVMTSGIIADSPVGEFSITPFQTMGEGNHDVYIEAVRLNDNVASKTIKVPFTIVKAQPESKFQAYKDNLKPSSTVGPITQVDVPGGFPWITVVVIAVLALGGGTAYYLKQRGTKKGQ